MQTSIAHKNRLFWPHALAVVGLIIVNYFVFTKLLHIGLIGSVIFNGVKIAVWIYVGWLAVRFFGKSLPVSALAAIIVFLFDHVALRFLDQVIANALGYESHVFEPGEQVRIIVYSYILFLPLAGFLGAVGGWIARKGRKRP